MIIVSAPIPHVTSESVVILDSKFAAVHLNVNLIFCESPCTMRTGGPASSKSEALSVYNEADVAALSWRYRIVCNVNSCGVWVRNRPSRGTVALIRPFESVFLSVSDTAMTGITPVKGSLIRDSKTLLSRV